MAVTDEIAKVAGGILTRDEVGSLDRTRLPAYRFRLDLDVAEPGRGASFVFAAACSDISGLECELRTVEYQEGGQNGFVHKFRGQASYPPLVLKRGLMASDAMWRWHQDAVNGIVRRRNGAVTLLDAAGDERMCWSFTGAMPVKWSIPPLNAASSALAFESVELVHRGLTLDVRK